MQESKKIMSGAQVCSLSVTDNVEYVNSLKSIEDRWPEYKNFRGFLEANSNAWYRKPRVTGHVLFHDILSDNSILPPIAFQADENFDNQALKHMISNPPASLRSRLIVVGLDHRETLNQGVLDILSLSFDIEPAFFWSLLSTAKSYIPVPRRRGFLRMSYMTLKILKNHPNASGDVCVGRFSSKTRLHESTDADYSAIIAINEGNSPWNGGTCKRLPDPFYFTLHEQPGLSDCGFPATNLDSSGKIDLFKTFGSLLCRQQTNSSEEDLLQCVLLMAKFHLATFNQIIAETETTFYEEADLVDWEKWYVFRDALNCFQGDLRAFSRYVKRELGTIVMPELLQKTLEDQEDLLAEAQASETLLRDLLQANVGEQSLKESRMSIEEVKRNKMGKTAACCNIVEQASAYSVATVTILAFIFVPTSLASSIFGMNVQEINNTGNSIWKFLVTAILLTGAAIAAWFLSGLAQAKWHSREKANWSRKKRFRNAMWLLRNPRAWYYMPQGTFLGVLTASRFGGSAANRDVKDARSDQSI